MQSLYFSPLIYIIIISSMVFIITALYIYYIINKSIVATYTFRMEQSHDRLSHLKDILTDTSNYKLWWKKFNDLFIYHTRVEQNSDPSISNLLITIQIHSNLAKEEWNIILQADTQGMITITVCQDLFLLSKVAKIIRSTLWYKRDLLIFKQSLIKRLALES